MSNTALTALVGTVIVAGVILLIIVQREPETPLETTPAHAPAEPESITVKEEGGHAGDERHTAEHHKDNVVSVPPSAPHALPNVSTPTLMPLEIPMESGMFFFKPNNITAKVGQEIILTITADGVHDFVIDELGVRATTPNGKPTVVRFTPTKAGTFEYYCSVGSHRARGQVGTLVVIP